MVPVRGLGGVERPPASVEAVEGALRCGGRNRGGAGVSGVPGAPGQREDGLPVDPRGLQELERLRTSGVISEAEYATKREQIINEI